MAEESGPWEVPPAGAEVVGDASRAGFGVGPWRRMMRAFGDGVIRDLSDDSLRVFASTSERRVGVMPGEALIQGAWYRGTPSSTGSSTTASFVVPNGAGGWQVVLRYDPAANTVRLALRGGGALTRRQDGVWEMLLATVNAPATGLVPQSSVRDDRTDTTSNLWRSVLDTRLPRATRHQPNENRGMQSGGEFTPLALHTVSGFSWAGSQRSGEPTRLYAVQAGPHDLAGRVDWSNPAGGATGAGIREATIAINGRPVAPATAGAIRSGTNDAYVPVAAGPFFLNPGDYVELLARHTQGAALAYQLSSYLSAVYVGAGG